MSYFFKLKSLKISFNESVVGIKLKEGAEIRLWKN